MYYWLQIRVARCRRRFHLKLLLAHGFLQTFPSFIQCVNAIGSYYVKICLICSEIHICLENTVIFFTKLSMISTNNRDKSFDIVTTELATKWINRPWSVLAEFWSVQPSFFHWKKIPFLLTLGHCRLCRWQYLPIRIELFTGDVGYLHIMTFFLSK